MTNARTTVGVITVEDPALALCLRALAEQDSPHFVTEIVRNVAPMSAAFNEATKRTETEFFISCDEDMILYPYAVRRMEEILSAAPPQVAMVLFHLDDLDRGRPIHGIKIFRTAVLKEVAYRDVKASEMDLLEQLGARGFSWVVHPEAMGRHGVFYTPRSSYHRYRTMYEKDIKTWNTVTNDLRRKAEAYATAGAPEDLFALLGAVHGLVVGQVASDAEKDFRAYQNRSVALLEDILLHEAPYDQKYDPAAQSLGSSFQNQPLPFHQTPWQNSRVIISTEDFAESAATTDPLRACVLDTAIVAQAPEANLRLLVTQNQTIGWSHYWLAVWLWNKRRYQEAEARLATAVQFGLPTWRRDWLFAAIVRDDRVRRTPARRAEAAAAIQRVCEQFPTFSPAAVFAHYLAASSDIASLVTDFCSYQSTPIEPAGAMEACAATAQEIAWCAARRPLLIFAQGEPAPQNSSWLTLSPTGYLPWHQDPDRCIFRRIDTIAAPNFWDLTTLIPQRITALKSSRDNAVTATPQVTTVALIEKIDRGSAEAADYLILAMKLQSENKVDLARRYAEDCVELAGMGSELAQRAGVLIAGTASHR